MMQLRHLFASSVAALAVYTSAGAQQPTGAAPTGAAPSTSIAERTRGMEKRDGFIPLHVDARQGKIFLELPRDSMRTLYYLTQASGLGSNPVGIDRGGEGGSYIARFDRDGDRVLLVLENWNYRGASDNPAHLRTVAEAFPASTVASLPLVATEGGRLLVDATEFVLRDWNDVAGTLARSNQGQYAVARDRSSVNRAMTKAFPDNTEIDAWLTFQAQGRPGGIVESIAPDGRAFTLRQHMTFMRLPDDDYRPRVLDPRVGYFGIAFRDYAQPIQRPLVQQWASRHRLMRANPNDPNSAITDPIVYYIDRGIPEPLRSASIEGAKFWEQAFDRAGLRGGFRVELLPEGADPMDARYNVVQWVNRNERGWSIGGGIADPRTGEIVKGMARMDSHRARTDYNIYAGLMGADEAAADTAFVLARVRQVTSHEIGHTLGLAHNYIASTYERGSVMDYPPPRVRLDGNGNIDIAKAYGVGPGDYDIWAIRWGYGIFPAASERDSLAAIVREGLSKNYLYLSDGDARPEFAADPRTNLWDDASTATEFLKHQMDVRRVALARFGERNIRPGDPIALLQERLAPMYFFHRFALNSVSKTIGGMEYSNAVRGDAQQASKPIDGARQREALRMLAAALQPAELAIPDTVLTLLAPGAGSVTPFVELFGARTRPAFDELGAARTLAQMIVDGVLQRDRAGRLVQFASYARNPLTLGETVDSLVATTWNRTGPTGGAKYAALRRVAQRAVADRLLGLAADSDAAPEVRALAEYKIAALRPAALSRSRVARAGVRDDDMERAHWASIAGDFERWIDRRELPKPTPALVAPPGDPFGIP
jgi:hypothetical protein